MPDVKELEARLNALESKFGKVYLGGDYGEYVPYLEAIRVNPALLKQIQFEQALLSQAIQYVTQAKLTEDRKQNAVLMQMTSDIIDDWCGTPYPGKFPPRPRWSDMLAELGRLTETLSEKSLMREAAFELSRLILDRAQSLNSAKATERQLTAV
jgi:hypothetical protein